MSLLQADARRLPLADNSVQCVVTSPPYLGLRMYSGIQPGIWGGDPACAHEWEEAAISKQQSNWHTFDNYNTDGNPRVGQGKQSSTQVSQGATCLHCSAWRGMLGLEPDYRMYLAHMVEVFAEVHRVLKPDGVVFCNIGDSYAAGGMSNPSSKSTLEGGKNRGAATYTIQRTTSDIPAKNLMLIPQRLAIALQEWGWYVRAEIIWHKPNPMPESVRDRPTKAHEQVWMLTKRASYYWDADAIREPSLPESIQRANYAYPATNKGLDRGATRTDNGTIMANGFTDYHLNPNGRNKRSVWTIPTQAFNDWTQTSRRVHVELDAVDGDTKRIPSPDCPVHGSPYQIRTKAGYGEHASERPSSHSADTSGYPDAAQTGERVPTEPTAAVDSEERSSDLPHPSCSDAATLHSSESRRTGHVPETSPSYSASAQTTSRTDGTQGLPGLDEHISHIHESNTLQDGSGDLPLAQTKYRSGDTFSLPVPPECICSFYKEVTENTSHFATFPEELVETCILAASRTGDVVLDPFSGSGTTVCVAERLGRVGCGADLSMEYTRMAQRRLWKQPIGSLFTEARI